jgi:hypothetical protein
VTLSKCQSATSELSMAAQRRYSNMRPDGREAWRVGSGHSGRALLLFFYRWRQRTILHA